MLRNATAAAQSSHQLPEGPSMEASRLLKISVRRLRELFDSCTENALFPYNVRADSLRFCHSLTLSTRPRNRTMLVHNMNTSAVTRSQLRCVKYRTENGRIYRTVPEVNVERLTDDCRVLQIRIVNNSECVLD